MTAPRTAHLDQLLSTVRSGLKGPTASSNSSLESTTTALKRSAALRGLVPADHMDAFLSELKTVKLRKSLSGNFNPIGKGESGPNKSSSSEGPGSKSFQFPMLRKVRTLPNGRKVSDLPSAGSRLHGVDDSMANLEGDESVLVDLTTMGESYASRVRRRESLNLLQNNGVAGYSRANGGEGSFLEELRDEDTNRARKSSVTA